MRNESSAWKMMGRGGVAALLAITLVLGTGCGGQAESQSKDAAPAKSQSEKVSTTEGTSSSEATSSEEAAIPEPTPAPAEVAPSTIAATPTEVMGIRLPVPNGWTPSQLNEDTMSFLFIDNGIMLGTLGVARADASGTPHQSAEELAKFLVDSRKVKLGSVLTSNIGDSVLVDCEVTEADGSAVGGDSSLYSVFRTIAFNTGDDKVTIVSFAVTSNGYAVDPAGWDSFANALASSIQLV